MTTAKPFDDLHARLAAMDLVVAYWHEVDCNDGRETLDFFTTDCVYLMCGHRFDGPASVASYYSYKRERGARLVRHLVSNLQAHLRTDGVAIVVAVLCVYAHDGVAVQPSHLPVLVADMRAECVRGHDGKWRFRHLLIEPVFQAEGQMVMPQVTQREQS